MVESSPSLQAEAYNNALLQFNGTSAIAAPVNSKSANDNSLFINSLNGRTNTSTKSGFFVENISPVDNQTLLNNISSEPRSNTVTGNLTAQQLQEIAILQADVQMLNAASVVSNNVPLKPNEIAVDLSVEAQASLSAPNADAQVNANASTATSITYTPQQLAQIGTIVSPFVNQPLTPAVVAELQTSLAASQFNPVQISLSTLLLAQNYIASMQSSLPQPMDNVEEENAAITDSAVAPISATDRVAAEGSAVVA